jgi:transposase
LVKKAKAASKNRVLPLRMVFQDEARFGRITEQRRCWAAPGVRPRVNAHYVREYTYAYAAVSPLDGAIDFLILPVMSSEAMNRFLAEVAQRHRQEYVLMLYDGAGSHSRNRLSLPDNMMLEKLPPYCPELNPTEHLWDEMREKFFPNFVFDSLEAVEERLMEAMIDFENHPERVKSITGFSWILKSL